MNREIRIETAMYRKLCLSLALRPICGARFTVLSAFTVDRTEFVYLTQFGRHVATYDGADDDQAGLHFRLPWPIQSVQRLDRRLQYFDLPGAELLTRDAKRNTIDKTLTIDAYVCWRIADAPAWTASSAAWAASTAPGRSSASASTASWAPPSARWNWTN